MSTLRAMFLMALRTKMAGGTVVAKNSSLKLALTAVRGGGRVIFFS